MPPNDSAAVDARAREYSYDSGAGARTIERQVAVETPVNLIYGGVPFAVMVATPADLEDFAYGFSLTEGVIEAPSDIRAVEIEHVEQGLKLRVALAGERMGAHLARTRAIAGRTGCGLCGIDDLRHLPAARRAIAAAPVAPAAVKRALEALEHAQPLNDATHAVHAAAWCGSDGALVAIREDVGRHNALDKLIGALARSGAAPDSGFFVITSRCSFEMVAKVAAFGAATLVAVSAPTSLAIERARDCGITIIAIARADHALIFAPTDQARTGGLAA
jgi:FdhD protein